MHINEYQELAMKTLNPNLNKKEILINSVMGLCGEAGEVIDIVKKNLYQGHPFDREAFIEELGDITWYLAEAATAIDISLEEVFERNIEKLNKRFPKGFNKENSIIRKDKA